MQKLIGKFFVKPCSLPAMHLVHDQPQHDSTGFALQTWITDGDQDHRQSRKPNNPDGKAGIGQSFTVCQRTATKQGTGDRRKPSRSGKVSRLTSAPRARLHDLARAFKPSRPWAKREEPCRATAPAECFALPTVCRTGQAVTIGKAIIERTAKATGRAGYPGRA